MSDLQCTEQRQADGTIFPLKQSDSTASSIPIPMRPICCTKNSPLPAAHLLCDRTLLICAIDHDVNQKRFPAKRHHGVKIGLHLVQSALNGRNFGDVAQMPRHAEIIGTGEILFSQELFENRQRATLVWHNLRKGFHPFQRSEFDRQSPDIYADVFHHSCTSDRL